MRIIPANGDLMTMAEFADYVTRGFFTDHDGCGYYATATEMSNEMVKPSEFVNGHGGFTHVVWMEKQTVPHGLR